jgi:hypothetical protein
MAWWGEEEIIQYCSEDILAADTWKKITLRQDL